jgi:hypothetical protein
MLIKLPRPCLGTDILEAFYRVGKYRISWFRSVAVAIREPTWRDNMSEQAADIFLNTDMGFLLGEFRSSIRIVSIYIDFTRTYEEVQFGILMDEKYNEIVDDLVKRVLENLKLPESKSAYR